MQFGLQVYVLSRSSVFGFSLSALLALVFTALSILRHSLGAILSSMGVSVAKMSWDKTDKSVNSVLNPIRGRHFDGGTDP